MARPRARGLSQHLGAEPRGWRAPSFAFSKHSLRYLLEAGFEYDSSLMGDDIPYALRDGNASLLEFPVDWTLDDFPHYAHNRDLGYRMPISSPQQPCQSAPARQARRARTILRNFRLAASSSSCKRTISITAALNSKP